jgi:hypothetical protein
VAAAKEADYSMREALVAEVKRRAAEGLHAPTAPVLDFHAFTRSKVAPMVHGLFPEIEHANVLSMLERSVVFLTSDNIDEVLRSTSWLNSAWTLANLYLLSIGAELLSGSAPRLVLGLSEETTCYVSHEYFLHQDRFADFVVHEAAHVFHNCKRQTVGLPETRTREFLLNIDFCQRETFAYACEVYSRILELTESRSDRRKLVAEIEQEFHPPDDRVDIAKFRTAVDTAAEARNGWKKILQICSPVKRTMSEQQAALDSCVCRSHKSRRIRFRSYRSRL